MSPSHFVATIALAVAAGTVLVEPTHAQRSPGLLVKVYELDQDVAWVPDLAPNQSPSDIVEVPTLDLKEPFGSLKEGFLTEIDGFLTIAAGGRGDGAQPPPAGSSANQDHQPKATGAEKDAVGPQYAFRLTSDDGGLLTIDGKTVVNHDGLHGPTPKDGSVALAPGEHALRIRHFQGGGGAMLKLEWKPPGAADFALVPREALSHAAGKSEVAKGKKKIIPPLRRGRPGDGTPVAGMHPSFDRVKVSDLKPDRTVLTTNQVRVRAMASIDTDNSKSVAVWLPGSDEQYDLADGMLIGLDHQLYRDQLIAPATKGEEHKRLFIDGSRMNGQGCALRFASSGRAMLLKASDRTVLEILAVRAKSDGVEIEFTKPLDPRCGWEPDSYYIEQWPFSFQSDGGSEAIQNQESKIQNSPPTRDGIVYPVKSASVSDDRRMVFLEIENLKPSHVVYLRLLPPCLSEDGELPWSTEAWYTLNAIPKDRTGQVRPRPPQPPQNALTDAEKADGWRLLFDGKTTAGWHTFGKPAEPPANGAQPSSAGKNGAQPPSAGSSAPEKGQPRAASLQETTAAASLPGWSIIDGALVRTGPGGDICTDDEFQNFELKIDWRIAPGGNSGIIYGVSEAAPNKYPWETGPECQVLDNAEHADGRNPITSAGSDYALYPPTKDVTRPVGFFNEARIVIKGDHVEHWLNGEKLVEHEWGSDEWKAKVAASKFKGMPRYGTVRKGHIDLQDHGDRVWYRNIKIRELK